ncbi:MAG: GtrA family protein [Shimia sp.]
MTLFRKDWFSRLIDPDASALSDEGRTLWGQAWRFGAIAAGNTLLGYVFILFIVYLGSVPVFWANVVGYGIGWVLSYWLNRQWTFKHKGSKRATAVRFAIAAGVSFGVNLAIIYGLKGMGVAYPIAQICGAIAYAVLFFWMLRTGVFRT